MFRQLSRLRGTPVVHLFASLVFRVAVTALEVCPQAIQGWHWPSGHRRQLAPLLFNFAFELLPIPFDTIPVHRGFLSCFLLRRCTAMKGCDSARIIALTLSTWCRRVLLVLSASNWRTKHRSAVRNYPSIIGEWNFRSTSGLLRQSGVGCSTSDPFSQHGKNPLGSVFPKGQIMPIILWLLGVPLVLVIALYLLHVI